MTLTLALRTALSGLSATQSALQVTSSNITNVNTVGYSRKAVSFTTRTISGVGAGVNVANVDRVVDQFLIGQIRDQQAALGNLSVREEFLSELEALFSSPDNDRSVTKALDTVRDALEALSVTPESSANNFNTINELRKMTLQIQELSSSVQSLRLKADQEVSRAASTITNQLEIIADLNTKIARAEGLSQPSGEERDERDRAVKKLSEFLDVRVIEDSSGMLTILTNTGRNLLSGSITETVSHISAVQMDAALSYLAPGDANYPGGIGGLFLGTPDTANGTNDITDEINSGRLKGLIDLRDEVLPNLQSELDNLVHTLNKQINAVHNQGTAFPPPSTLAGTHTVAGADVISGTGTFTLDIINTTDGTVVETDTIDLSTVTTVTDLVNAINTAVGEAGFTASVNSAGKLQLTTTTANRGVAINEGTGAITVVGTETRGFSHYFGLNDLLVADVRSSEYSSFASARQSSSTTALGVAGNLTFEGNFTNSPVTIAYTAGQSLDTIAANITADTDLAAANITAKVVNDGTGRRLVISDSDRNNFIITDDSTLLSTLEVTTDSRGMSGVLEVKSEIVNDPTKLARGTLNASAAVGEDGITQGDGTIANSLAGVFESDFTFSSSGGISGVTTTLARYSAQMLGLQAAQTADARAELQFTTQFTETLEFRSSAISGVNLDEELANLVVLEQAFNASARIITVAAEMLQELIDSVR